MIQLCCLSRLGVVAEACLDVLFAYMCLDVLFAYMCRHMSTVGQVLVALGNSSLAWCRSCLDGFIGYILDMCLDVLIACLHSTPRCVGVLLS
jgi:hypothetical protein